LFHFWWLIFPLGGMIGGGVRAVAAANERRADRRLERYRIKQQTKIAVAEAAGRTRTNEVKNRRELKRRADLLRPENAADLDGDREAQLEYRDAVHDYVSAFDVAETEAIRLRRSTFSADDQQRIARAQNLLRLAEDDAATPQERQNAYTRARVELDGILVLPSVTRASIERKLAGELEA
jgi:hypothetical protein